MPSRKHLKAVFLKKVGLKKMSQGCFTFKKIKYKLEVHGHVL